MEKRRKKYYWFNKKKKEEKNLEKLSWKRESRLERISEKNQKTEVEKIDSSAKVSYDEEM